MKVWTGGGLWPATLENPSVLSGKAKPRQGRWRNLVDPIVHNIPNQVLDSLSEQAQAKGISQEEHVRRILYDALNVEPLNGRPFVSVEFLLYNYEAVLSAASKQLVYVFDAAGKEFVIINQ